jgi:hypothetical protein
VDLLDLGKWTSILWGLRRIAEDEFTVHIPTKIYTSYLKERIDIGIEAIDELQKKAEIGKIPPTPLSKVTTGIPDFEAIEKERAGLAGEEPRVLPKRGKWTTLPPAPARLPTTPEEDEP